MSFFGPSPRPSPTTREKAGARVLSCCADGVVSRNGGCYRRGGHTRPERQADMEKKHQYNLWYAFAALFLILMFQSWWATKSQIEEIPYSEFETLLQAGRIDEVAVRENTLQGKLKDPNPDGKQYFRTTRVEPEMAAQLAQYGVTFKGEIESTFLRDILSWILPVVFFVVLWMFVIRRMAEKQGFGGLMTVGKSKAKVYVEKDTKVTFENVAGVLQFRGDRIIPISIPVEDIVDNELFFQTYADIQITNTGSSPSQIDAFNTVTYTLSSTTPGVGIQISSVVPEPSIAPLLALLGTYGSTRRRRRVAAS